MRFQVTVLLLVLQVWLLLLRREADGGKRATDEAKAWAERVRRRPHEVVRRSRARTVLRAAGRRGRRVPASVRPDGGHSGGSSGRRGVVAVTVRNRCSRDGGGCGSRRGQRQLHSTADDRVRVYGRVHRLRRRRTVPAGGRQPYVPGLRVLLLYAAEHHRVRKLAPAARHGSRRHGHGVVLFRVHTVRHGADGHVLQHRPPRSVHQAPDAARADGSAAAAGPRKRPGDVVAVVNVVSSRHGRHPGLLTGETPRWRRRLQRRRRRLLRRGRHRRRGRAGHGQLHRPRRVPTTRDRGHSYGKTRQRRHHRLQSGGNGSRWLFRDKIRQCTPRAAVNVGRRPDQLGYDRGGRRLRRNVKANILRYSDGIIVNKGFCTRKIPVPSSQSPKNVKLVEPVFTVRPTLIWPNLLNRVPQNSPGEVVKMKILFLRSRGRC